MSGPQSSQRMSGPYNIEEYKPKWIRVFRNGDPFFPGVRFPVTRKRYRSFEYLLDDLTKRLDPVFGAVRHLYTTHNGTPIKFLHCMLDRHAYVACGAEKLKHCRTG